MSEDPIGFNGDDINLYRYVKNNTFKFVDPNGQFLHVVVGAGIGAVTGGVLAYVTGGDVDKAILSGMLAGGATALGGPLLSAFVNSSLELYNQTFVNPNSNSCGEIDIDYISIALSAGIGYTGGRIGVNSAKDFANKGLAKGLTGRALKEYIQTGMAKMSSMVTSSAETVKSFINSLVW